MEPQQDFKELLALFNPRDVRYVIVGGYAPAFHGAPRFTGHLDLLVEADDENAGRILGALSDLGFGSLGLAPEDFVLPDRVVQLGVPPVRVDILSSISGVRWDDVWNASDEGEYGDIRVPIISREPFIRNKRAAGRTQDLADVEALGED